ncbi:hypothetical protein DIURU_004153 [Diutina rugosa]|uniref:SAC domain-containing protein n=1 Tax=Diutina rugosa TaxID=5481 RepID=A0A642UMN0_DIURU|nr:uncharacterized protein DIURU_004153 [Diutina rugosa]KAA8899670.1 hypothetical protein DIURU_004153 [Diutina rugosa]
MSLQYWSTSDGTHVFSHTASQKYLELSGHNAPQVSTSPPSATQAGPSSTVAAILGTIRLKYNTYVIVIDTYTTVGRVMGKEIAKVGDTRVLPIGTVSEVAKKSTEEQEYVRLLKAHLSKATLYFSLNNEYDLTNSLQRQYTGESKSYDQRFWWNHYLSTDLVAAKAGVFVTPVIYGYVHSYTVQFAKQQYLEFALITRRSVSRAGTRYFRRGVDTSGDVANYNETEQVLVTSQNQLYSLVQTRGSVPVYWAEINNLKYKPNLVVSSQSSADATAKHFDTQVKLYGDQYCVNLVNQSGYEKPVKDAYENAVETLPPQLADKVNYIYFDFHHECSKMRWDRVKLLLDVLVRLGYTSDNVFHYDLANSKVISTQNKVVRTNCMDCLDRTNVVQSTIARWVLQRELVEQGYVNESSPWEIADPDFNLVFMSAWADNADAVSKAYSGTGALKTDYTRTGKRTKQGALKDLQNSISRYYQNNLSDGHRQDAYDLILGVYRPYQDSVQSPFIDTRPPYDQLLPYLMGTSLVIFLAMLIFPKGSLLSLRNLVVLVSCIAFNVRSFRYLNKAGYQFVDWPRLVQLDFLRKTEVSNGNKVVGSRYVESDAFKVHKRKDK